MGLKKLLVGLVAVAAVFGVSGCSQSSNVAATVGDMVITEAYVHNTAHHVAEALVAEPGYNDFSFETFVLKNTIAEKVLTDSLAQMQITITDEMREQEWPRLAQQGTVTYALWDDPLSRQALLGYIDAAMVHDATVNGIIDGNKLQALIDAIPVTLNPRYGIWNSKTLNLSFQASETANGPLVPAGPLADPRSFTLPSATLPE